MDYYGDEWEWDDESSDEDGLTDEQIEQLKIMIAREVDAQNQTEQIRQQQKRNFIRNIINRASYLFNIGKFQLAQTINRLLVDLGWAWPGDIDDLIDEIMNED